MPSVCGDMALFLRGQYHLAPGTPDSCDLSDRRTLYRGLSVYATQAKRAVRKMATPCH